MSRKKSDALSLRANFDRRVILSLFGIVVASALISSAAVIFIAFGQSFVGLTDQPGASQEQLPEIESMLETVKAATEKYRDVDLARADGYRQVMGALHGTGAHFVNQQYLDEGSFHVAHPEGLLYDQADDGSLELVGVAYMLPRQSDNETPPTYFGPLAEWHDHDFHRPCLTSRTWGHPVTVHSTETDCRAAGNVYIQPKFWMLHVWLFRASPGGIFSHENSTIEGPPDISVAGEVE